MFKLANVIISALIIEIIHNLSTAMGKTAAERMRAYRDRKRVVKGPKKQAKSSKQRSQEWRARKKLLKSNANIAAAIDVVEESPVDQGSSNNNIHTLPAQLTPYTAHQGVHREFRKKFIDNPVGSACTLCDRLWLKSDLKTPDNKYEELLQTVEPNLNIKDIVLCKICTQSLSHNNIHNLSKYNGFRYPEIPPHLPPLELVSERLISPRIPFMQIRSLRHVHGQRGIFGRIMNVPVSVNNISSNDTTNIVTPHMDISLRQSSALSMNVTEIGEVCAARCSLDNGQTILAVALYISPNQAVSRIIQFIHEILILYTPQGSALVGQNYDELPMILGGDFNVNFATKEAQPLIEFLDSKFNMKLNNDSPTSTTRSETTNDAVFSRYLDKLRCLCLTAVYESHISYHKPIISFLEYEDLNQE